MPAFNPQLLLNPKAAKQRALKEKKSIQQLDGTASPEIQADLPPSTGRGMASMIEKMHNVEHRRDQPRPIKRRKRDTDSSASQETNQDDSLTMYNQTPPAFTGGQGTGELGEYMKEQRQKAAATNAVGPPTADTIDLTDDQDPPVGGTNDDDDVIIVDKRNEEVCLGRIEGALVNAHRIPFIKMAVFFNASNAKMTSWPAMRVDLARRPGTSNYLIDVSDAQGKVFGSIDTRAARPLSTLMDGAKVTKLRLQARLDARKREHYEIQGQAVSDKYNITINVYAPRMMVKGIGKVFSDCSVWLRNPIVVDRGFDVVNPHAPKDFVPKKLPYVSSSNSRTGGDRAVIVTRTNEEVREDVFKVFDSLKDTKDLPELDACDEVITPLLRHQKQALYFMTEREKHPSVPSMEQLEDGQWKPGVTKDNNASIWQKRTTTQGFTRWFNVITGQQQRSEPKPTLGGVLADVMGLGKTLNVLALAVNSKPAALAWEAQSSEEGDVNEDGEPLQPSRATLLVCPVTTIVNWKDQIETHLQEDSLTYYVYQGPKRTADPAELKDYDMIITSYSTVAADFAKVSRKRAGSPLFALNWFRVVLDEAHIIRTQTTNQSKAACALHAQRRWCLTGTPVQNRLDDLGALIKFLRIKPFDEKGAFSTYISAPLKSVDVEAVPKLRLLVDSITLRRLKDKINLPERTFDTVKVPMEREERALYDQFSRDSHRKLDAVVGPGNRLGGKAFAHILKSILRLRFLAASGGDLLSDDDWKLARGFSENHVIDLEDEDDFRPDRSAREAFEMLHMLEGATMNICIKCNEIISSQPDEGAEDDSYNEGGEEEEEAEEEEEGEESSSSPAAGNDTIGFLTPCNQLLCPRCIGSYKAQMAPRTGPDNYGECVVCSQYIRVTFFELRRSEIESDRLAQQEMRNNRLGRRLVRYSGAHSKTKQLIKCLLDDDAWSQGHPNERPSKSVVFSEWTNHLDLIEMAFREKKIAWQRIDGSMSVKARTLALRQFDASPTVNVILISIKAGGLGINLTAANRVYVMQPNYNPGVERQAIERVHRLGQTREVHIRRFIMQDSIEEKILELQEKKERLADFSVERGEKLDKAELAKQKLEDLKSLFR